MNLLQSDVLKLALLPRSLIRALWRRKLPVAACWVAGTAAAAGIAYSLLPVYSAEALILVESQKIPENFVAATVQTALESRLDRLKQQVLSRERLWALIGEFKLYSNSVGKKTQEEVVEMMRRDIGIRLERGWSANRPGAFRVTYETEDPVVAADITNRIGGFFINEHLRERAVEAAGTSAFLDSQLAASKKHLEEQEAKLSRYKLENNGELPQQEAALLAAMGQSKAELLGIQDALARAQQNKLFLENTLAIAEEGRRRMEEALRRRSPAADDAVARLALAVTPPKAPTELERAEANLKELRLRYSDSHPDVARATWQVEELRRQAAAAAAAAAPPPQGTAVEPAPRRTSPQPSEPGEASELAGGDKDRSGALKSQIALAKAEIDSLERRRQLVLQDIAEVQQRVQRLPLREQQMASITRDYETSKANYRSLLDKKLAADVAENMEKWEKAEKFVMLDAAKPPEKPIRPRRFLLTAGGSIFSLLLAVMAALLLELKKNVVLGEWELPPDTTVLGAVPRMRMERV